MSTPIRYDEIAALDGASSALHWGAIVRCIARLRSGAMPSDWETRIVASGLHASVSARWPAPMCFPTRLGACSAYRRRGLTWSYSCTEIAPGDLTPETACADPRRFDAWARRVVASQCLASAAGCL